MITVMNVHDVDESVVGARFLVDRVWPRGVTKASLDLTAWSQDAAPSTELRRWFGHDPEKWAQFQDRYIAELDAAPAAWAPLAEAAQDGDIVLLFGAHDREHNNAVALREYLQDHPRAKGSRR